MTNCPNCFKSPGCPICLGTGLVPFGFAAEYALTGLGDLIDVHEDPIGDQGWFEKVQAMQRGYEMPVKGDRIMPNFVRCPRCRKGISSPEHGLVSRQKKRLAKGDLTEDQYAQWAMRFCRLCHAELVVPVGLAIEYQLMGINNILSESGDGSFGFLELRARHGFTH